MDIQSWTQHLTNVGLNPNGESSCRALADSLSLPDGRIGLVLVTNPSALLVPEILPAIRDLFRECLGREDHAGTSWSELNRYVMQEYSPCFISTAFAIYDLGSRRVNVLNAGCEEQYLVAPRERTFRRVKSTLPLVGVADVTEEYDLNSAEQHFDVAPGDVLALHAGIVDSYGDGREPYAALQLRRSLQRAIAQFSMRRRLLAWSGKTGSSTWETP